MSQYTAETTIAEAFIGNTALKVENDTIGEKAWDSLAKAVKAASPDLHGMHLLNCDACFPRFTADFVVELSDYMMVCVRLSYDQEKQSITLDSTLDASKDGHGLMSSEWTNVADACTHVFKEEDTLSDLCEAIQSQYCEMAYEALHRANRNMYPGSPSDALLGQLKAAVARQGLPGMPEAAEETADDDNAQNRLYVEVVELPGRILVLAETNGANTYRDSWTILEELNDEFPTERDLVKFVASLEEMGFTDCKDDPAGDFGLTIEGVTGIEVIGY